MSKRNNKIFSSAEKSHEQVKGIKLTVSFQYIDWTVEEFFVHGLDSEFYKKLFNTFHEINNCTEDQITEQKHKTLIPKSIFNTDTSIKKEFSREIVDKITHLLQTQEDARGLAEKIVSNAFEIRTGGRGQGRIHGFIWDKKFHVVWFDPAHNLYTGKNGKTQGHKNYATVKSCSMDAIEDLKAVNQTLTDECNKLRQEYDQLLEK